MVHLPLLLGAAPIQLQVTGGPNGLVAKGNVVLFHVDPNEHEAPLHDLQLFKGVILY